MLVLLAWVWVSPVLAQVNLQGHRPLCDGHLWWVVVAKGELNSK